MVLPSDSGTSSHLGSVSRSLQTVVVSPSVMMCSSSFKYATLPWPSWEIVNSLPLPERYVTRIFAFDCFSTSCENSSPPPEPPSESFALEPPQPASAKPAITNTSKNLFMECPPCRPKARCYRGPGQGLV